MYTENDFRTYELYHHGILGQKWGVRRYQNKDGSLTPAGKKRVKLTNSINDTKNKIKEKLPAKDSNGKLQLTDQQKKALKIGAAAVGTALAAYGAYKLNNVIKNNVDTKNLELASLAGANFANRFIDNDARPMTSDFHHLSNAQRIGNEARGPLASKISEKVYNNRGGQFDQLKRAKQFKDLTSGKITLDEILSYTDYTKEAINDTKWDKQGQEWLARALRDLNGYSAFGVKKFMSR